MGFERERRSIGFEKKDEEKRMREGMKGLGISMEGESAGEKFGETVEVKKEVKKEVEEKVPNISLMGLSMLGSESNRFSSLSVLLHSRLKLQSLTFERVCADLDGIYQHAHYENSGIKLHTYVVPYPSSRLGRPALSSNLHRRDH